MEHEENRAVLFEADTKIYNNNSNSIKVSQSLYNIEGKLYLETSLTHDRGGYTKKIQIASKDTSEATIQQIKINWEQMKTEMGFIKTTIGGYIYNKTGAKISINPQKTQNYKITDSYERILQYALDEYLEDWKGLVSNAHNLNDWQNIHPLQDTSRILHHVRGAIYEGKSDETPSRPVIKLDIIEKSIMDYEDLAEKHLRLLYELTSTEVDEDNNVAFNKLKVKIAEAIDAFDDVWIKSLVEIRNGKKSDMSAINIRCNALEMSMEKAKSEYKNFQDKTGLFIDENQRLDDFDAMEKLFEEMSKTVNNLRSPYYYQPKIVTGMNATSSKRSP